MSNLRSLLKRLWQHKLMALAVLVALALVGGVGGTAVGLTLEENNEFCAQCHTQPEYDFWMRTQVVMKNPHEVSDLATFHIVPMAENKNPQRPALTCISCHGGATLSDRLTTMFELGALDTIRFVADDFKQPAKLSHPLPDRYCLQCHQEDVEKQGFDNHFHNKLEERGAPPLSCTSCHLAHAEADTLSKFVLRQAAYPQCNECHKQLGGPINLR